ncbi:hypothetical protein ISF_06217 [Cordyceps fumosorosea ARSEF 2679]|uniref:Uncharacterized protein n=1 Tax=Cordyceps fumosorosea (strain ARSEF 2679) TaxID=1081104 RepID=A0A167S5N2_CORFA|nr:hypothetical protein ISF_06217 [Cordyceps fumosorosea ARSEF 2679]OAA59282.1 hypothetical protein ISF_06217 [Cordyceps fumosorosea ARSEF 2679]
MASDPKLRRRASSAATRNGRHAGGTSRQVIKPKSAHTADEFAQDFLGPSFDAAAFLNTKLPPLAAPSRPSAVSASSSTTAVPLADLAQQAGALVSQLNAQTTRLSSALTQLTDDILRSGSRLAYEVELLRGETLGLSETMRETLRDDIAKFLPEGAQRGEEGGGESRMAVGEGDDEDTVKVAEEATELPLPAAKEAYNAGDEPIYVQQLRTLTLVRSRIETVVKTFGDAMDFGFPPSEVSVSSSFLSVSAPEPGSQQQSSEERGQQNLKKLRDEIGNLLRPPPTKDGVADPVAGIEQAANRIEELKELNGVWKGTAEEKGRAKFIESLAKMVEDRHKELMRELDQQQQQQRGAAASPAKKAAAAEGATRRTGSPALGDEAKPTQPPGGFGLISQLQKLRSGL